MARSGFRILVAVPLWLWGTFSFAGTAQDLVGPTIKDAKPGDGKTICATDTIDGIKVQWCTQNSSEFDHTRVLWHLHGLNEAVDNFATSSAYTAIKATWRSVYGLAPPVLIAVSFGNSWTLSDLPSQHVAGHPVLYAFFINRVIPYLERKLVGAAPPAQRWLMGRSMGSYNSSLLLERNPELWNKVVLGCPALFTITPFSTSAERDAYVARNVNSTRENVDFGLWVLGRDEPTLDEWLRNDPLGVLLLPRLADSFPPVFVWFNQADGYGFGEGARAFITTALLQGMQVGSASNTGSHCLSDPTIQLNVADFLR